MQEILDKLANGVIGGHEDLMGMGECLNMLDKLEVDGSLHDHHLQSIGQLKKLFNRIILEESEDRDSDWQEIRQIATALNEGSCDGWTAVPSSGEAVEESDEDWGNMSEGELAGPAAIEILDPELVGDFLQEGRDHLSSIEMNLLALESNPEDMEAISAIFRPFHSIKGVSGFLNLQDVHKLTHHAENLLDEARSGKLQITEQIVDVVLEAVDILKKLLNDVQKALQENVPVQTSADIVKAFCERLEEVQRGEPVSYQREAIPGRSIVEEATGVEPEKADMAVDEAKEVVQCTRQAPAITGDPERPSRMRESATSVRIDTQKLDNLVDMVGELVIAQSMVLQNPELQGIKNQKLQKDSIQLRRITNEMQRIAMSMRMVPIKSTFQKVTRLVRDLSRKSGKEVFLEMRGEETEIDRNMVEEIYDPLVHMIRNSVDHGIEMPEEREAAGKNRQGRILIGAEQKGGNIVIDIKDDGRGLDADTILKTAVKRGVVSAEEQLDEKTIYELIFHPGFSTKEVITEVSGRGVGMDVVKKCVEHLRGKMEIFTAAGKGTHFQFKFPLTMAIIDGMIIRVGEERYVVPTIALQESLRPSEEAYMTVQGKGELIKVRDNLMPLIRFHQIFDVEPMCRDPWEGLLLVVNEDRRG
ncbi:MAG: chemotaxis protein CheA [Desulforhabdus sp.]|jgi:two-component system chemotaxis sensor kinase CheA|nr:chemotaxis protein CheA [Desulforhabdus sp.]